MYLHKGQELRFFHYTPLKCDFQRKLGGQKMEDDRWRSGERTIYSSRKTELLKFHDVS